MRKQLSKVLSRIFRYVRSSVRTFNRKTNPIAWHDLRRVDPLNRDFGYRRGTPIDRYYIEQFLMNCSQDIHGHVLEVANAAYTIKFGGDRVEKSDILHVDPSYEGATIIGNLESGVNIRPKMFDCIILTETLFCIFDLRAAVKNLIAALKPGGVLLISTAGIAQLSQYDVQRWGDYWRLTNMSLRSLLAEAVPGEHIQVTTSGNVLAAISLLHGIVVEDLTPEELDHHDPDYEVTVFARVTKPRDAEIQATGS